VAGSAACDWGVSAKSVAGTGTARIVTDPAERLRGLDAIMRHAGARPGPRGFAYRPATLARTAVLAVRIDSMTARRVGSSPAPAPADT
jgi:nitroimidazol reductase NimA-like FMN-containing flavoprotein (pyridoxamine 5'-phosphate oxidase superfamily)